MSKLKKSITVEFWDKIFYILSFLSIFILIKWVLKKTTKLNDIYQVVDIWVLFNFFLALCSIFVVKYLNIHLLSYILIAYGFARVFEIIICQINILLFDEYRAKKKKNEYLIRGYRRMVVNLLSNFTEVIFWFSASYCCFFVEHFSNGYDPSILQILFTSFSYTTGFGLSDLISMAKISDFGVCILYFQSIAGLIMALISISRFISFLPSSGSMDEFESE